MGLTVGPSYITDFGIQLSSIYLSLTSSRILPLPGGNVQTTFIFNAYTSRSDKLAGANPIPVPYGKNTGEMVIPVNTLINTNLYTLAYQSIANIYSSYELSNMFEPGQIDGINYRFNSNGYDINGYNAQGYNTQGYDINGYNVQGYNAQGYNAQGYNAQGYNAQGYNAQGYNAQGYNAQGYDINGYNTQGYNAQGYNAEGYNAEGYNAQGYDINGYNAQGYNAEGYNAQGYNEQGLDINGNPAPTSS